MIKICGMAACPYCDYIYDQIKGRGDEFAYIDIGESIRKKRKRNGERTVKNTLKAIIECAAVLCGLFLIIHRCVFAACLTGDPMPEPPDWHKKLFGCAEPGKENTEEK